MKKRVLSPILSCVLAICLTIGLVPFALARGSLSNFSAARTYSDGMFSDVDPGAWYLGYVERAYEYELIDGYGNGRFNPGGKVTIAEAIKLAVCLYRGYYDIRSSLTTGGEWYEPYVRYARLNGLISKEYPNYNAVATRADFVSIIGAAMPDEAVTAINRVDDGALPDVMMSYSYGPAVYRLYRAGVLTGGDKQGTFYPGRSIQRSEAVAICVRMLDAESRVEYTIASEMRPDELYARCTSSVLYIEIFDKNGDLVKTGSGFFINSSGDAVTNFHVIAGAHTAKVMTADGNRYDVLGVYDYNWKKDIAIISVDGDSFDYLPLGDSNTVLTGETVYAIGSPIGLQNTMSRGIVSSASRVVDGVQYIQTDAPLSSGSSGGPLMDSSGLVIGIVSAGVDGAQNLNFAVPINLILALDRSEWMTLDTLTDGIVYYSKHPDLPDLGACAGVEAFRTDIYNDHYDDYFKYSYKTSDFDKSVDEVLDNYRELLAKNLYSLIGYYENDGTYFDAYYNASSGLLVLFGVENIKDVECITVIVSQTL